MVDREAVRARPCVSRAWWPHSHAERTRRHRLRPRTWARAPTWSSATPANRPGMKWVGDITYIRTWEGFVYLATVPGCCTRKAVGYAIGATTCVLT